MPLSDSALRAAKPRQKPYRLFDAQGLYCEVSPRGGRWWRFKYRIAAKEKRLSFGVYPQVSLKAARLARDDARRLLSSGVDPSVHRKLAKLARAESNENTFKAVAVEWLSKQIPGWAISHSETVKARLENDLYPRLGTRPIREIGSPELLQVLRKIEERGAFETAKRVKQIAGQIFRYAIATGRADRDPSQDLRGALQAPEKHHLASTTNPAKVGPLLLMLDGYVGTATVRAALKLAPLVFVRPGELRQAKWIEFDLDQSEWVIPAARMKMRIDHIVPLSTQALAVLREMQARTGHLEFVFPSARSPRRPMSDNAVLAALRRLGIPKEEMCGHGFRAMARTILDEVLNYRPDWIEHQLAHEVKDPNGRSYNRTSHLEGRRAMMQAWADYLDTLRQTASQNS